MILFPHLLENVIIPNNDFNKYSGESKAGSSLEPSWSQNIFIEQVLYAYILYAELYCWHNGDHQ